MAPTARPHPWKGFGLHALSQGRDLLVGAVHGVDAARGLGRGQCRSLRGRRRELFGTSPRALHGRKALSEEIPRTSPISWGFLGVCSDSEAGKSERHWQITMGVKLSGSLTADRTCREAPASTKQPNVVVQMPLRRLISTMVSVRPHFEVAPCDSPHMRCPNQCTAGYPCS